MDERETRSVEGCMDERTEVNGSNIGWKDGQSGNCINRLMDERMDGQTNGEKDGDNSLTAGEKHQPLHKDKT